MEEKTRPSEGTLPPGRSDRGTIMLKIGSGIRAFVAGLAVSGAIATAAVPAQAGDYSGDFLVRIQGTVVSPDVDASLPGFDVSEEVIPTLTLSYFFNKNIAVELFCCFAKHQAELGGSDVADFWIFPPALTLQYHFDGMGGFKPYVGAGLQYIAPFSEDGVGGLAGRRVEISDEIGFTLQAGFDMEIGQGWYLNADVKKTFIEHDVTVRGGPDLDIDLELDPWIFSVGVGYRFNLSDIFGARHAEAPMK
jgi:outer membrane protein